MRRLTMPEKRTLDEFWPGWAHDGQAPPAGRLADLADDGRARLRQDAGRGGMGERRWRAGRIRARAIALVGGDDRRGAQGDGRGAERAAGGGAGRTRRWMLAAERTGVVRFASGARGLSLFGGVPGEIARARASFRLVRRARQMAAGRQAAWDNLLLGLRLGRAAAGAGDDDAAGRCRCCGGSRRRDGRRDAAGGRRTICICRTAFVAAMEADYGGTRLGRQELDGELIEDAGGGAVAAGD